MLIVTKKTSFRKFDKIKKTLDEWNTIEGVELYAPLYNLYNKLFLATQDKRLECLNYYIDKERNGEHGEYITFMYAEIKDTWELPMKERYKLHLNLLKRVLSDDKTLVYCEEVTICDNEGQLSLFG